LNKIRELRKEKNMTQADLAKVLKVSSRTIGFYETGDRDPDTETLGKLADYFATSIDYLLGRSDIRQSANYFNSSDMVFDMKYKYNEDLPKEAKDEIEKFAEYIRYKYGKDKK
jgi:transcriptional regulator with XRE-family HTH domain